MARKKHNILKRLRWDILLLILLALGGMVYFALQSPRLRLASSDSIPGSRPPDRAEGDVLLLLPDSPAAEASSFYELDCSYGWYNALWQEFGSFATSLTRNLSPEILAGRSIVIVPSRVAESMPSAGIEALARYVDAGGQLIVEHPTESWRSLSPLPTVGNTRHAVQMTSAEGLGVQGVMRDHLLDVPLAGKLLPSPPLAPHPTGPVLLEVDGQPGLAIHDYGAGYVYTILFDFGCTITAMLQGKPSQDMQFGPPGAADLLPSSVRRMHERLSTSHIPYAELLKSAIFMHPAQLRPIPRLWRYPQAYTGAFMVTHSTMHMTDATLGYTDWARQNEGNSTVFIAPDMLTSAQSAILLQTGTDLGLLWVLGVERAPSTELLGVGKIRPIARELTLAQQIARLQTHLPAQIAIRQVRTEGSLWHNDWSRTFKHMAHANVRVDSSFGPSTEQQYGYLFGTGLPFYPIDERGLPLPILELPYLLHGPSVSPQHLRRLFINSENYFHQSLNISIPSDAMLESPSAGMLLAYHEAFDMAREYNHWITTAGDFVDFLSARRQSILTSQWFPDSKRLTISVNLAGTRVATFSEEGAVPGLAIPGTYNGEEITRILVNGKSVSLRNVPTLGSSSERLLHVGAGRHTVAIYYGVTPPP